MMSPLQLLQAQAQLLLQLAQASNPSTTFTVAAIMARACTSGYAQQENEIILMQWAAQGLASAILLANPATAMTVSDIMARACTSGFAILQDPVKLDQAIAQNFCNQTS